MAAAVRQDLAQLMNSSGSHKDLAGKYRQILEKAIQLSGAEQLEALKAFVEAMVNENVSLVISRQLLTDFCTHLPNLPDSTAKEIYHFTLEKIQPRVISFEEQVASIRQHLASIYEKEEDWRNAAQVLVGIPLETGQKQYNVDYKLETYLKIARLYLEDDDPVQAEAYINRASLLQNESTNEQLQIHYKVCYARVLDYRRKFIEAAQRYNELSYKTIVHESERLEALKHALHCTILASAGQQRSRMLATLFKDERCQQLAAYGILEKMYLDRIIRGNQLQEFAAMLMPHQKATRLMTGSLHVAQAGLELLGSSSPPILASQSAGMIGVGCICLLFEHIKFEIFINYWIGYLGSWLCSASWTELLLNTICWSASKLYNKFTFDQNWSSLWDTCS
ncbi:COPS4 isoform 9 [Pongo abelii]|uniref:COPS4 isoform 9 n=1 Tax=Pongo abelii TaxID=9601 RepID=A0A2J8QZ26_PONAB|nr:COPS4 isoform 9 [Pongo abelii]